MRLLPGQIKTVRTQRHGSFGAINMTDKAVASAVRLYEIRDTAKRILKDDFDAKMADVGLELQRIADEKKCSILAAAADVVGEHDGTYTTLFVMAAAVELIEKQAGSQIENR